MCKEIMNAAAAESSDGRGERLGACDWWRSAQRALTRKLSVCMLTISYRDVG